jgi:hypothetical protein
VEKHFSQNDISRKGYSPIRLMLESESGATQVLQLDHGPCEPATVGALQNRGVPLNQMLTGQSLDQGGYGFLQVFKRLLVEDLQTGLQHFVHDANPPFVVNVGS